MPLEVGKSKAAFGHNIGAELKAGKPKKQAVAIAYAEKRKAESEDAAMTRKELLEAYKKTRYELSKVVSKARREILQRQLRMYEEALKKTDDARPAMDRVRNAMAQLGSGYGGGRNSQEVAAILHKQQYPNGISAKQYARIKAEAVKKPSEDTARSAMDRARDAIAQIGGFPQGDLEEATGKDGVAKEAAKKKLLEAQRRKDEAYKKRLSGLIGPGEYREIETAYRQALKEFQNTKDAHPDGTMGERAEECEREAARAKGGTKSFYQSAASKYRAAIKAYREQEYSKCQRLENEADRLKNQAERASVSDASPALARARDAIAKIGT